MLITIILLVLIFLFVCAVIYDRYHLVTTVYHLSFQSLPEALKGKRALLLTDLHQCTYGEGNRKLLSRIRESKPDLILIAGDMVSSNKPHKNHGTLMFIIDLARDYPVYYALGNHEHRWKEFRNDQGNLKPKQERIQKKCQYNFFGYENMLKDAGVHIMDNKSCIPLPFQKKDKIMLYGLDLPLAYFSREEEPEVATNHFMNQVFGAKPAHSFCILLAHDPIHIREYAAWGADLVLSGHIHGGMIRLPYVGGIISPHYEFFPDLDAGLYEFGKTKLLLSRGLGSHSLPIRFLNPPELVVIQF